MPQIKQLPDGSLGIEGTAADNGAFIIGEAAWNASSGNILLFTAQRKMVVQSIIARVEVAGTDGGAVTATVYKAPSATAIASGTALHSGTINLKGTAATNQTLTLSTTPANLQIAAGDTIGIVFTGTLTSATGCITVSLTPA